MAAFATACLAQNVTLPPLPKSPPPAPPPKVYPAGSIEGAKTPDAIPDDKAYEVFFATRLVPANASAQDQQRQVQKLARAKLNAADIAAVQAVLEKFRSDRENLNAKRAAFVAAGASAHLNDLEALDQQFGGLIGTTRKALQAKLSPAGMAQLHQHVMAMKAHVTIINGPYKEPKQ